MKVRNYVVQVAAVTGLGLLWAAAGQGVGLRLKNVEVLNVGDGARMVLDVDGVVTPKSFTLKNPDRIVVDLVGAANGVKQGTRTFETGPVSRVRVSQFKSAPQPVTRVVADLRTKVPFRIESQDEDVVVVVGTVPAPSTVGVNAVAPVNAAVAADGGTPAVDASSVGAASSNGAATPTDVPFSPVESDTQAPSASTPESAVSTASAGAVQADSKTAVGGAETVAPSPAAETTVPGSATETAVVTTELPQVASQSDVAAVEPPVAAALEQVTAPAADAEPMQVAAPVAKPGRARRRAHVAATEDTSPDAPPGGVELKPSGNERRINIDVQGADIHTVLRTLAEYSGKNIIAGQEVEGTVTARLYDTPWDDALHSILKAHGYGYVEESGIIRVGVLQKIRSEELEDAAADRKREDLLPIETQVVRLQFADADELKPSLQDMMSPRGKVQVDKRTNALIISDIPDYVAKVAAMANDLDSRTPQVEIVSKIVDVSADNSRDLGIQWDAINLQPRGSNVVGGASVKGALTDPIGKLRLGTVQSWGQLDAILDALEKNKKANVVSNPNITTVNNREARILVGAKIPLIVADQAGNAITQLTKIGIQMSCTPHVDSDHTITMDLHTEVSELSSQATVQGGVIIQTSEADTRVLVENGDTAIIGGLVRNVKSSNNSGVPVLQDIPLLGWLFRNSNMVDSKRELIIFVTPRLIEAGQKSHGPDVQGSKP
jgi:type IV pilus assembly protein PilQ